jgi:hypothetical protein
MTFRAEIESFEPSKGNRPPKAKTQGSKVSKKGSKKVREFVGVKPSFTIDTRPSVDLQRVQSKTP